jgi:hypothetical protein
MAKVSKSYQELLQLVNAINILSGNQEHASANTKGIKKLQKIGTKMKEHLEAYNEKLEDIRLDNAHTEENGCLILDEKGGYKFSKDGLKKMNKDVRVLLDSKFEFYQFTFSNEGIETYGFLEGWVEGIEFPEENDEFEEVEEVPVVSL